MKSNTQQQHKIFQSPLHGFGIHMHYGQAQPILKHKRTYHSPSMLSSLRDNALRESNNAVNWPLFPRPHFLNNNTNGKPGETRFHGKYLTKNVTKMVKVKYQRDKFSDENRAPM